MNDKILITGGNGYIGSHLINYYLEKGNHGVASLDIGSSDSNYTNDYHSIDITDNYKLSNLTNHYDIIIHCAGSPSVPLSVKEPLLDFKINLEGTLNMLEFSRKKECKFILLSSVSVFDYFNRLPLNENSIKKPTSPYGAAKLAAEAYCQAFFRTYNMDTRIVRIFNTYGPGMKHLFISDMINKINDSKDKIMIGGSGNQIRDYVYIKDLVKAIDIIINKGEPGEDYNICSGEKITLINITKILLEKMNREYLEINCDGKSYKGDIEEWYGDPSKIGALGFEPQFNMEKGLEEIIKG